MLSQVRFVIASIFMSITVLSFVSGVAYARGVPNDFSDIVDQVYGAVGNVTVLVRADDAKDDGRLEKFLESLPEEFRKEFRDRFNERLAPDGEDSENKSDDSPLVPFSQGSAFLISEDGYMVTNNHVIKGATEIKVSLNNSDEEYTAELVGTDAKTDIALIKLQSDKKFPYVILGDSDKMKLGNWVIAVGNPMGFGGTVTAGIVSADSRYLGAGPYDNYIQTDVAINRGNSGGPLFNLNGEVIGVNTIIVSPSGASSGLGFAIPSKQVKLVVAQLKEYGTTRRGWLGVSIQNVDQNIADNLGLGKPRGALVEGLHPDGPSLEAGIKTGDIILKFNGEYVASSRDLPRMVANTAVDSKVDVVVWRDGKEVTVTLTLGELEKADLTQAHNSGLSNKKQQDTGKNIKALGLGLSEYSERLAEKHDLPTSGVQGVIVTSVDPKGPAAKQGIAVGMVISHVQTTAVASVADFEKILATSRKKQKSTIMLRVGNGTQFRFVTVRLK